MLADMLLTDSFGFGNKTKISWNTKVNIIKLKVRTINTAGIKLSTRLSFLFVKNCFFLSSTMKGNSPFQLVQWTIEQHQEILH
jgi:hypothetical protein